MIKKTIIGLATLIGLFAIFMTLFTQYAPQFGAVPTGPFLARIQASPHYQKGKFVNDIKTNLNLSPRAMAKTMWEFATAKNVRPRKPLPTTFDDLIVESPVDDTRVQVTWFGHSAVLLEMAGQTILLDPMLGPAASPVSFFGRRFAYRNPIPLDQLTAIDAVVYSHDHYDHLDYTSVRYLKDKTQHFFVPLGVGAHLRHWGVADTNITELDWWESANRSGITFTATPARHFSGRGLTDRDQTLWASWVIQGAQAKLYFSGDSGYGPHFRQIGERYGPFDFTMIECGQYNEKWEAIHMMPYQSLQAHLDVRGRVMMPIHWGAFNLSVHPWREPVEWLLQSAQGKEVSIVTPIIGERFDISRTALGEAWWK